MEGEDGQCAVNLWVSRNLLNRVTGDEWEGLGVTEKRRERVIRLHQPRGEMCHPNVGRCLHMKRAQTARWRLRFSSVRSYQHSADLQHLEKLLVVVAQRVKQVGRLGVWSRAAPVSVPEHPWATTSSCSWCIRQSMFDRNRVWTYMCYIKHNECSSGKVLRKNQPIMSSRQTPPTCSYRLWTLSLQAVIIGQHPSAFFIRFQCRVMS